MSSLGIPYITFEIWLLINRECRNYTRLSGQITRRTSCLYFQGLGLQAMYYPDQVFMRVLGIKSRFLCLQANISQPSHSPPLCYFLCSKLVTRHCHNNGHGSCLKTMIEQFLVNHYLIKL